MNAPSKPNLLEIAQKQREVKMLEKIQRGIPLTQSEMKELAKYQNGDIAPGTVTSIEQVAKVFEVTPRTVSNWVKEGMPKKDNRYDLVEIQSWRFHRRHATKNGEEINWDAKYREYKARLEEGKFKAMIGELVPMREVESGLIEVSIAIKRALLSLPRTVAPRLVGLEPREIEGIIRERVEEIIKLFATDKVFGEAKNLDE